MDLSAQPPPSSSSQNGNGFEDVAGPNYNTPEPAPAARPSFAPAAGTVPSSRASHLTVGLPQWGGLISRAPVLSMALQKAWLKMRVSSPPPRGAFWAGCCQPGSSGCRSDGEQDRRTALRAPALRLHSPSKPAPSQFAEGDQKLIVGFGCVWRERG